MTPTSAAGMAPMAVTHSRVARGPLLSPHGRLRPARRAPALRGQRGQAPPKDMARADIKPPLS
jgi:hypothetical protein